jgi:hypothetical protein
MTEYKYASITEQEHEALYAYLQSEYFKDPEANLSDLEKSGEWVFNALSESEIWACKRYVDLLSVELDYESKIAELQATLAEKRKELDALVHYEPSTQMYILRKDD